MFINTGDKNNTITAMDIYPVDVEKQRKKQVAGPPKRTVQQLTLPYYSDKEGFAVMTLLISDTYQQGNADIVYTPNTQGFCATINASLR